MLRVGIVGAGIRGRMYTRALRQVPGVEVVALCDPSEHVRREVKDAFGVAVYPTHEDLFAEPLDAAIVATPDFAHYGPVVDAAAAGLHLLVEKPLAMDMDEAVAMREAIQAAGVQCMVAFENRWSPPFMRARQQVEEGVVGDVISQTARLSNVYDVPTKMLSWSARSSPGWFLMPHTVDLALWLSGKQPVKVYATGVKGQLAARGIDTWDAVHALVNFADGTVASFESLWVLPDSMPSMVDFKYELVGSQSALFLQQQDQMLWLAGDRLTFPKTMSFELDGAPQGSASWMTMSWARTLLAGERLSPGVDDGLLVSRVVHAVHESLDTGTPVALA